MRQSWIVGVLLTAGISSLALAGQVSVGLAEVQGLDDLYVSRGDRSGADPGDPRDPTDRVGCPGGYVDGLGCSGRRLRRDGPGIQDSDQGWQRDWQDFQSGGSAWSGWGYGWGNGRGGENPRPRGSGLPRRDYSGDGPPRGLGRPYWPPD